MIGLTVAGVLTSAWVANQRAYPDQAWYWTPDWQLAEQEAEEDIREGRMVVFDSDDPSDIERWLLA